MIVTIVLTLTMMGTVWLYAAFTEPTVGPAASDQDFVENILGVNDANNEFDSSSVAANNDGSIVERQKYIANDLASSEGKVTYIYITSATHEGDFGGRSGLDSFCEDNQPLGLSLCENIHALISVSATDEIRDMPINYGYDISWAVHWWNGTGAGVGADLGSWYTMLNGSITNTQLTGTGNSADPWSGSTSAGALATDHCSGWTYTGPSDGEYGSDTSTSGTWLSSADTDCNIARALRCACTF